MDHIAAGHLAPGERLVETRIARELGVSQGVVREALRQLQVQRVVEHRPHQGCRVRDVDQRELDDVARVRAALEGEAARLAAARGAEAAPLLAAVDAMRCAAVAGDSATWAREAVRFHRGLVKAAGNPVLLASWEGLLIDLRTAHLVLTPGFDLAAETETHRRILDAVLIGDVDLAGRLSYAHEESFVRSPVPA